MAQDMEEIGPDVTARCYPLILNTSFLCLCLILVTGCGRKAPPVPPGTLRPQAITDLRYKLQPEGIELIWSIPVRNRNGSPLAKIKGFRIYKAEVPVDKYCRGCPPHFGVPIEISFQARPAKTRKMIYEDRTVSEGMRYIYEVRTVKGLFNISDSSNRISIAWHSPPLPPRDLIAQASRDGVFLSWSPTSAWADGRPVDLPIIYKIYRHKPGAKGWKALPVMVHNPGYFDASARRGQRYAYKVTAVLRYHGTQIESRPAGPVWVSPRDLVPPRPPGGLVAVRTSRGIELSWQENTDMDLAGYIVYRKGPGNLIFKLNHVPLSKPYFIDRTRLSSGHYTYWITAVDLATPPNESSMSEPVTVDIK